MTGNLPKPLRAVRRAGLALWACCLSLAAVGPVRAQDAAGPSAQVLQVTAASAEVRSGKTVIGSLHRGQWRPLGKQNGAWYAVDLMTNLGPRRGYVSASDVRLAPAYLFGPGQGGQIPETTSDVVPIVDWQAQTQSVQLGFAALSAESQWRVVVPGLEEAAPSPLAIQWNAGQLTISGSQTDWQAALVPGTRSLWVQERFEQLQRWHRLDVAPVSLAAEVTAKRLSSFTEGLLLYLSVHGAQPGFLVESVGGERPRPLGRRTGVLPRIADVKAEESPGATRVRLAVAFLEDKTVRKYRFRVRNPDGSVSETVEVTQTGDKVTAKVRVKSRMLPVDATVELPSFELLTGKAASALAQSMGIRLRFSAAGSLRSVPAEESAAAVVLLQGRPAGSRVWAESTLLLSVQGAAADAQADLRAARPLASRWAINVGDLTGFVGLSDAAAPQSDRVLSERLFAQEVREETALPIGLDPGVCLDPQLEGPARARAALLELLIEGLLARPSSRDLPGPLGGAIRQAIERVEPKFLHAFQRQTPAEELPADEVLSIVADHLGVQLSAAQEGTLLEAWRASLPATQPALETLDRNANGRLADDVAIALCIGLLQHGWYDVAAHVEIDDSSGEPLALLSSEPHDADWIEQSSLTRPDPPLPGVPASPATPPEGTTTDETPPTQPIDVEQPPPAPPQGEPVTRVSAPPDEVRVPELEGLEVAAAQKALRELGLGIVDGQQFFNSDEIVSVVPRPGQWVASGTLVELTVLRPVPDVVKRSYKDAQSVLTSWHFAPAIEGESFPSDLVITQRPEAGEMAPPGATVRLELSVIVPNVVGMLKKEAVTRLQERDLLWRADTRAFNQDKVVEQDPPAGALLAHGGSVLVELRLPVPNVEGRTLAKAREILQNWDLLPETPNDLVHEEDVVRGQQPQAGTFVEHGSSLVLDPVLGIVPDVVGETVGRASRQLRNDEDYLVELMGDLESGDRVQRQKPEAGAEYERGRPITLDARVRLPDLVGEPLDDVEDILARLDAGLLAEVDGQSRRGDPVFAQDPEAGTLVYPRSTVVLVPGVIVPRLYGLDPDSVRAELRDVGLRVGDQSSSTQETTDQSLVGQILVEEQSPRPGVYARRNVREVDVAYVEYILALRTVPLVAHEEPPYLNVGEAVGALRDADLDAIIRFDGQDYSVDQFAEFMETHELGVEQYPIVRQYTSAGERVPIGTRIYIEIGVFR